MGQESDLCAPGTSSGTSDFSPTPTPSVSFPSPSTSLCSPSPRPQHGASRIVELVSPQYVVYTDTELEQARSTFFEKQHTGEEAEYMLSKELRCRLIRNTVTSMNTIKRAAGDDFEYPCSRELTVMSKRLIDYYPMLRDRSATTGAEWESVKKQLTKRVQNVSTPKRSRGRLLQERGHGALAFKEARRCPPTLTSPPPQL